jgi:serine/threonine protein kinase/tetratricopeptide (TPR) repeat protein
MPEREQPKTSGRVAEESNGPGPLAPSGSVAPVSDLSTDSSVISDLDPGFTLLIDQLTQRIQDGGSVNIERVAAEHPDWSGDIRRLLPALLRLADLNQAATTAPSPPDLALRDGLNLFGDFRVLREIGRGGMGVVYEAQQLSLNRRVALKMLPPAVAIDSKALRRFQLEAQVAGLLQHPRIVTVYSIGLHENVPYYSMRLIEGGSLADLLAELRDLDGREDADHATESDCTVNPRRTLAIDLLSGRFALPANDGDATRSSTGAGSPLPIGDSHKTLSIRDRGYIRTIASLGIQAAEALGYAHDQGVVHRDIKPANLLLDHRGDLWVADFGMANVQGEAGLTTTGDLPGTLRYMSPEQALGKRALVDRRTDIYSLCATLYELLALYPAVPGTDRQQIFRRINEWDAAPIQRFNPAVPIDLATILTKGLSRDPQTRYETAWRLAADLGRFLDGLPIMARPVGAVTRAWRWCCRKPLQASLVAALGLTVAVGLAGITWNWREAVRQKSRAVDSERRALASEQKALTQAAKADAINLFLIDKLLTQAEPETNPAARRLTLLEVLDRAATEVGKSFGGQPEVEAAIRMTIGKAYHGLGEYGKSEAHYRAAYELLKDQPGESVRERLRAMSELGHSLVHQNRLDEAEPLLVGAFDESRRALGESDEVSLAAVEYFAKLNQYRGRIDEAESLYRQLVAECQRIHGTEHMATQSAINNLGVQLVKQRKYEEAEPLFRASLAYYLKTIGKEHATTANAQHNLGFVLSELHRLDEARELLELSVAANCRILGAEHPTTLTMISKLAEVIGNQGNRQEAELMLRKCLDSQTRTLGSENALTTLTAKRLEKLREKDRAQPPK